MTPSRRRRRRKSGIVQTNDAEEAALLAVCEYRCSPDELALKFRYLSEYRDALTDEQREVTFASLVPEGEA